LRNVVIHSIENLPALFYHMPNFGCHALTCDVVLASSVSNVITNPHNIKTSHRVSFSCQFNS